jgi:HEPN domain-containing protein
MRHEAELWLRQAKSDLKNAEKNIGVGAYDVAAFLCQQAVEKLLKATYIVAKEDEPPRTHTIVDLGRELAVPKQVDSHLRMLTPDYLAARYPDAANAVPAELYDEEMARERLRRAREVFQWAQTRLPTGSA